MQKIISCVVLAAGIGLFSGCGDDVVESIDNAEACEDICDKYDDCLTDIDKSECVDYCRERADDSENIESQVEACESCIDDTTCAEATVGCGAQCVLVPVELQAD